MSISPPTDIVLDVARAADPVRYRDAAARLSGMPADAGAAFESALAAETPKTIARPAAVASTAPTTSDGAVARKATAIAAKTDTDFEAMVLSNLLEAAMPDDGTAMFGKGTAGNVWKSMLIEQIAGQMAKRGGIGIAAQLAHSSLTSPPGDKADTGATRDAAKALLIDKVQRGFMQGARDDDHTQKVSL